MYDIIIPVGFLDFAVYLNIFRSLNPIPINRIYGASAGALAGLLIQSENYMDIIDKINFTELAYVPLCGFFSDGLMRLNENTIRKLTSTLKIKEWKMTYATFNNTQCKPQLWNTFNVKSIMAACSVPIMFESVEIDGEMHSDFATYEDSPWSLSDYPKSKSIIYVMPNRDGAKIPRTMRKEMSIIIYALGYFGCTHYDKLNYSEINNLIKPDRIIVIYNPKIDGSYYISNALVKSIIHSVYTFDVDVYENAEQKCCRNHRCGIVQGLP